MYKNIWSEWRDDLWSYKHKLTLTRRGTWLVALCTQFAHTLMSGPVEWGAKMKFSVALWIIFIPKFFDIVEKSEGAKAPALWCLNVACFVRPHDRCLVLIHARLPWLPLKMLVATRWFHSTQHMRINQSANLLYVAWYFLIPFLLLNKQQLLHKITWNKSHPRKT
jgi:hypothetical protein